MPSIKYQLSINPTGSFNLHLTIKIKGLNHGQMRRNNKQIRTLLQVILYRFSSSPVQHVPNLRIGLCITLQMAQIHALHQTRTGSQKWLPTTFLNCRIYLTWYRPITVFVVLQTLLRNYIIVAIFIFLFLILFSFFFFFFFFLFFLFVILLLLLLFTIISSIFFITIFLLIFIIFFYA